MIAGGACPTTLNRIRARGGGANKGLPLQPFTVHDLRRTGSTLLNEIGFNRDWIEVPGARDGRSSRSVTTRPNTPSSGATCCKEWANPGRCLGRWADLRATCQRLLPALSA